MGDANPRIVVTPPAFCRSAVLRQELSRGFSRVVFNERDRYLSEPELIAFLQQADAAIVGRDPVSERVVGALPELKMIAKYGVGLDNIDQEALGRHGVNLGWAAGVNRRSVAELALCFMIGLCHKVFAGGFALKGKVWQKDGGVQLTGKTVGIIGCGHVGGEVIRLLAPFGCRVLVRDILDKTDFCRRNRAETAGLDDLIAQSDIVSLHVPLTESTRGMIDENVLRRMKPSAFLINTSRGEVVGLAALKKALCEGFIAGAGLDVFPEEPPGDHELLNLPNLMVTPHIGGNTGEAVEAMGRAAIRHLEQFFRRAK
ncbi:MAG: phosphoglycerate dehydrogenase [Nitrospinaceae bacterium]